MGLGDIINNVKDTINEGGHKSAAEGEQAKRDVAGDQMSVGDKAKSMLNQTVESAKGETAAAKRDVREETT